MAVLEEKDEEVQVTDNVPAHFSKFKIVKNVIILCLVFFITFTAYDCLSMLQSTLNHEKGIGVISQAIVYGCFCVSSLLFPKYVIKKLGCKVTLVLSMLLYLPYVASNLYPHWSFMVPAAAVNGLVASLLWGSQCQYLNDIAVMYAAELEKGNDFKVGISDFQEGSKVGKKHARCVCDSSSVYTLTNPEKYGAVQDQGKSQTATATIYKNVPCELHKADNKVFSKDDFFLKESSNVDNRQKDGNALMPCKNVQSVTARFFGIFGMAYLSTHMCSNLMSFFILERDDLHSTFTATLNSSCTCGAQFCNEKTDCFMGNLQEPSQGNRNFLIGLCLGLGFVSILILALFLDSLNDRQRNVKFSLDLLMATGKHLRKKQQIFLIPLSFYIGMIQGFFTGDFNMSFVGCAWGTFHVGLVSACYGAACAVSSPLLGFLVKKTGRALIFVFAALVNFAAQVLLLTWVPNAEAPALFFVIAALWGTSVGILWSQVKAIYGLLFKENEEAAFAAYHLWYSLGFCLSFAYSNHLCTYIKIYVLMAVLIVGLAGYLCIEVQLRYRIKRIAK